MKDDNQNITPEKDWLLHGLVSMAHLGVSLSITITIDGFLISGRLISSEKYFKIMGIQLDDILENVQEHKPMVEEILSSEIKNKIAQSEPITEHTYIHLEGFKMLDVCGNSTKIEQGVWRSKISRVSGFTIGVM